MAEDKPADPEEKLDMVEEAARTSLRNLIGNDGTKEGTNVFDLARKHGADLSRELPAEIRNMVSEGQTPLNMLSFLRGFIDKTITDLEEKVDEQNSNTDIPD